MNWTEIIISTGTFIAGGGLAAIVALPQLKRAKELENENSEIAQWKDLYQDRKEECDKKDSLINDLYANVHERANEVIKLTQELAMAQSFKCVYLNCGKRKPPLKSEVELLTPEEKREINNKINNNEMV